MKYYGNVILALFFVFGLSSSSAQINQLSNSSNYWSDINERSIPNVGTRYITPVNSRTMFLDLQRLKTDLSNTQTLDFSRLKDANYIIELPMPEGGFASFAIAETPIMEKPLSDLFPEIKTYSGFSLNKKGWYLKLDITHQGFHAMILNTEQGTIFIDPYSFGGGDLNHYIVYYKKDYASSVTKAFTCDVQGNSKQFKSNKSNKQFGTCELRTYRLALAATGEYTNFHGGTAADAQSAQVTTMNRVNGVYERDMAITMVIIGNNNLLIYTNGNTDPYSNGNASAMLGENQSNINSVIGSGNYDIGHVFGTNSGGIAGLGVVCNNNNKARGVTGSSSPIGDTFDIDYVAHEMGHQFSGNHCFNNSCSGNRNNATAMEPGSASTIMGYAGICSPNVQNFSDDYFHGVNLEEISNFITGGGHTCPVITPLSNDPPTITSTNGNVTIPANTPFALTATAIDTNVADVLTYCWEQMDNDISTQSPVSSSTGGPNFRSLDPSTNPTRYFPNLTDLLAGGPFTWEVLPSVSRTMDFRVTVRDNAIGGSCSDHQDITLTVDANAGPFVVTYPSIAGISWTGGSSQTITWDVAGTDGGGVNCSTADIFLSTDGGQSWSNTLASGVPNDGSEVIVVPNVTSTNALIMVMCSNGTFFDISDNEFEITSFVPAPPVANFQADVTTTCTGEVQFTDLSSNLPTSWLWNFGDGGTSTSQNPLYTYASGGTYSVQLTATNTYGSDSILFTSYIVVTKPAAPSVTGASICGPGSVTLSASGTNTLNWYDDSIGTNLINTGNTYTTPVLSTTTNYYVEEEVPAPLQYVGPADNTIGSGGIHTNTSYWLIFDCFSPFTLVSVKVYADGAGIRTIEYRNSAGTVLQDTTVNLPDGESRVTLNFDITPGTNYQLATSGQSNMYRNNGGVNFPYSLSGIVSITGNNIPDPNYYYYYYDWEIREPGCTSEPALVTATINNEPNVTINTDNAISCTGSCDGILSAGVSSGTPSYTYSWSNAQTTSSISGLCAGNYDVTVTDVNGCTGTDNLTLTDPPGGSMSVSTSGTNATCGNADGTATASPTSGTSPYTYLWSNGQSNATATGLAAGSYYVTVTDANGCSGIDSVTVFNTLPTLTSSVTNVSCNGGSDGTASTTPSGGNAPYSYQWSGPGSQTNATATGLSAGTFFVTVTDNAGCIQADTVIITEPTALTISLSASDATCIGNDGTTTVMTSGGTGSYTYEWSDPNLQSNITATGLSGGTYSVTVSDGNGCSTIDSITVGEPSPIIVNLTPVSVSCNGGSDGSIAASATGGNGSYTYVWDDPSAQTSPNATGLSAGTFSVTVTDNDGCFTISSANVQEPTLISVTINPGTITCNGGNDGTATAVATGGTGTYTYSWNTTPTQTTSTATGLSGGTSYSVLVTDANNCIITSSVVLTDPAVIVLSSSTTDASCGNADGSASITIVSGGTAPFTYNWSSGSTSSTASGLAAGAYIVTVTDANNCSQLETATVSDAGAPSLSISGSDVSCNGGNDGSASVVPTGGTSPYTYSWSNAATTSSIGSISAGTYSVDVADALGCVASISIAINEPAALTLVMGSTDASCGLMDGTASVTASGGTGTFTYLWNDGQSTSSAIALLPGTYSVTVTDANNCSTNGSITVNQVNGPSVTVTTTDASCGNADGSATANATGGNGTYVFNWSNGQTGATITGLGSGNYQVTVTDGNNCSDNTSFTILDIGGPSISITQTDVTCSNASDGTATITATGGSLPYSYLWDDQGNSTTPSITGLAAGTYNVTLTDAQGCIAMGTTTINDGGNVTTTVTGIDNDCNGGCNGLATVSVAGGTSPYAYSWDDPGLQTNAIATGLCAGTYAVTVTDGNSCEAYNIVTITEPLATSLITTNTDASSPTACDGTATATASGGTSPFTYLWNDNASQTTATATNLCLGSYTVIVTDANGCISSESVYVDALALGMNTTMIADQVNIFPNPTNGLITISMSGSETTMSSIAIYDIAGSLIKNINCGYAQSKIATMNLAQQAAGFYYIRIHTQNEVISKKISVIK